MSNSPKISVIIPVYNTDKYLEEAVRSIMMQTLSDIEIIIVNDGSTDQSPTIISSLKNEDKRIVSIDQNNQGQSIARNHALDIACGEYVYFMDSDDILDFNALYECYDKCILNHLDFVFFDGESFFDYPSSKPIFDYCRTQFFDDNTIYDGQSAMDIQLNELKFSSSPCLYLLRRGLIEAHSLRFYPGIIHEDNLFTSLVYLYSKRVGIINKSFFKRRIRSSSTMTSLFSWKNVVGYMTTSSEMKKLAVTEPSFRELIYKYISITMTAVCYKARQLSLYERLKFINLIIRNYFPFIPSQEIIKILIPIR